jgi:CubicO group peptidase (beta-lactamase class C family)
VLDVLGRAPYAQTTNVIVVRDGEVDVAHHFGDGSLDELCDTYSMTKSVVATLVGIALRRRDLESLDVEIAHGYTLRRLLTMTAGIDTGDIDDVMALETSWLEPLLAVAPTRSGFLYDNGGAHIAACFLADAVGVALDEYAAETLFSPLGIDSWEWPRDPDGYAYGFGHLRLKPRDIARLGELYLADGGGVLDAAFVREATRPQSPGGGPEGCAYGWFWWVDGETYFAAGYAGQCLVVSPATRTVAVATGTEERLRDGWRSARHAILAA